LKIAGKFQFTHPHDWHKGFKNTLEGGEIMARSLQESTKKERKGKKSKKDVSVSQV